MDAVADVVAASKPLSEVPIHEMWHAHRPPIERYVLATFDIPGGQIFAGVGYGGGHDVVDLAMMRATLRRIIASIGETFAQSERSLTVETADKITGFVEEDVRRRFTNRPWWIEIWNEHEALTQTYAPWGRPRTR